jgi:hypothetical protein
MITEIYVEGQRLDLFSDIGADLNYSIDDVKDFASRNTNYSKTITIPGNANNNKVFGHIYDFGAGNNYGYHSTGANVGYNFDPTRSASCKIYHNKIQIFKGVIRLMQINIDKGFIEYECSVFGELGGFSSAIGNSLLEDLKVFSNYNTVWTATNVTNSWDVSGGSGIVFPLIDYGQCRSGDHDYHLNAFRPAFFVKELVNAIITSAKYTYTSAFFESSFFKSLIIPNNSGDLNVLRSNLLNAQSANQTTTSTDYAIVFNSINQYQFTNTAGNVFTFTGSNGSIGKFKIFGSGTYSSTKDITVALYQNTNIIWQGILAKNGTGTNLFNIDELITATLNTGDTIQIAVTASATGNSNYNFHTNNIAFDFDLDTKTLVKAAEGDSLIINDLLPKNIQQKDFFISICRMFNLYVWEDANKSNHLNIEPYIDFYNTGAGFLKINDLGELFLHGESGDSTGLLLLSDPVASSINWNEKLDYSQPITIKPMSELNARYYDFLYSDDDDFLTEAYQKKYNLNYGDRKEDTLYEFATDRFQTKLIFAPSLLVKRPADPKFAVNIYKSNNGTEERKDHKLRIMQFKKITGISPSYHIQQVTDSTSSNNGNISSALPYYGYAGHLDDPIAPSNDILFGVPNETLFSLSASYPLTNLYTAFWTDYLGEITGKDSKLLTCYLYLTIQDIYSLDFSQLIYLNGALWRLNKIIDFNPNQFQTTQVELLKVLETTYA